MAEEQNELQLTKTCQLCKVEKTLDQYHKNKQCKFGVHTICKECNKTKSRQWAQENKERVKLRDQEYYKANQFEISKKARQRYLKNWDAYRESHRRWKAANRHKVIANNAARKARRLQATPPWITDEHVAQIENFYWLANDLKTINGEDYHVDHIVPLRGENVCGLHVPWNLQVLPSDINLSKGNKHGDIA